MIQPRTVRFLRRFVWPQAEAAFEREIILLSGPSDEATIYLAAQPTGRSPAWVLLHGRNVAPLRPTAPLPQGRQPGGSARRTDRAKCRR